MYRNTKTVLSCASKTLVKSSSASSVLQRHLQHQRLFATDSHIYHTVPQVFDRIKSVANADIVKEVQALFQFKLHNEGEFIVDLKNDQGSVTKGSLPEDTKPDVVVVMDGDNLLKMFNRELQPTTAFMTGKLTVKGDLSKALALEKVMKAAREGGK